MVTDFPVSALANDVLNSEKEITPKCLLQSINCILYRLFCLFWYCKRDPLSQVTFVAWSSAEYLPKVTVEQKVINASSLLVKEQLGYNVYTGKAIPRPITLKQQVSLTFKISIVDRVSAPVVCFSILFTSVEIRCEFGCHSLVQLQWVALNITLAKT